MFKLMKIKDHLYMPPLKKYEKYGHFPWKLVIHFLIVLLTTCEVLFIVNNNTTYTFNQYTVFNKFFLNPEASGGDGGLTLTFTLFSTKSLKNYIQSTVSNYYSINSLAIDNYDYFYENDGLRNPPKLLVSYFDNEQALDRGFKFEYDLKQNNLGPFDDENVEEFIGTVQEFYVTFKLKHKLEKYEKTPRDCYVWKFKQRYNFSHHGSIIVELSTDNYSCESPTYNVAKHYTWVALMLLVLALCSLALTAKEIINRVSLLSGVKLGPKMKTKAWNSLGLREKLKFFNYWVVFRIFGNLFQVFGGLLTIIDNETYLTSKQIIIGFGAFFAWIGIIQFFDHRSVPYSIVHTLERSINIIIFYVFGVVPIFMGFAFLAICYFWQTGIYYNSPMSLIANYALVNGDSVYAFSFAGYQENAFMGQLYYYMFIVFFICCVHNLFIAIVEQSFSAFRVERQTAKSESSDEDEQPISGSMSPRQVRAIELQEKKKQSVLAFKKILNVGRVESGNVYDENTLKLIQIMDKITAEILSNLNSLENLSLGSFRFTGQLEDLKEHASLIVTKQIEPILEYFR